MLKLFRLNRLLALGLATFSLVSYGQSNKFEEQKITELLSKMTLQEKIGQMNQVSSAGLTDDMKGQIRSGKVGSILNELDAKTVNELQRIAIEESRLKIPLI